MKKNLKLILCFVFMLTLSGCNIDKIASTSTGGYKIYLVKSIGEKSSIPSYKPYEDSSWQDFVQNTKPEEIFITDQDVTSYDWNQQILTLSAAATKRIKENYNHDFQGQKYLDLSMNQFIVTLNDKPLYGGMFFFPGSQVAANYPLIYVGSNTYESSGPTILLEKIDLLKLSIIPTNLQLYQTEKMYRIKIDSIKDFFTNEGKLINNSSLENS